MSFADLGQTAQQILGGANRQVAAATAAPRTVGRTGKGNPTRSILYNITTSITREGGVVLTDPRYFVPILALWPFPPSPGRYWFSNFGGRSSDGLRPIRTPGLWNYYMLAPGPRSGSNPGQESSYTLRFRFGDEDRQLVLTSDTRLNCIRGTATAQSGDAPTIDVVQQTIWDDTLPSGIVIHLWRPW